MTVFEYYYNRIIKQDLLVKFNYKNSLQIPNLEKIVLSFSASQSSLRQLLPLLAALTLISSQTPSLITSKRLHLFLKVKNGVPVGCKVDLRGKRKFLFLEKIFIYILPRLKDIKWSQAHRNFSLSIDNIFLFKEIEKDYEFFQSLPKLNVNLVFKARFKEEIFCLLSAFKFPFFGKKKIS
jgi:large subunit ribosomal protein L5